MTNKKSNPLYIFHRSHVKTLFIGIGLIILFFVIYFFISIKTARLNFYSFFFHSIGKHIFLTILSGVHVAILGTGILTILIAAFNMTLQIYCYNDRFELSMLLQKKKIIEYDKINGIVIKIFYLNYDNLFKKYNKKECRIFFYNPIYDFYLCYPINGYFDDIEISLKKENIPIRCIADKDSIDRLLNELKSSYSLNIPYLP